jgi:hypothetical protein
MDTVAVRQLIVCTKSKRGNGSVHSPIRIITEVCDFDGNLIAEDDPMGGISPESILEFLKYKYAQIPIDKHIQDIYAYFIESDESTGILTKVGE